MCFSNICSRFSDFREKAWNSRGTFRSIAAFLTPKAQIVPKKGKETKMLGWALTFLVVALIAALFGFGGIASASAGIAQILFFVFIALFVIAMIVRALRGRPPM